MHTEPAIEQLMPQRSRWWTLARALGWTLVGVYFAFAAVVLGLRYWFLPNIGDYNAYIEQAVSRALGERVTIGGIEAGWQGLRPELMLTNVAIHDRGDRPALSLPAVEATLAWTSVLYGVPRFYALTLDQPNLEIRRDTKGKLHVAGIELHPEATQESGIADWLLAQREIVIRNGSITWDDELRSAPRLALPNLSFVLRNGIETHRFALRASAPPELASALDVRGELHGRDLHNLKGWTGRMYAELGYTDIAAWQKWLDYPVEFRSGKGAVRVWASFSEGRVREITADVALAEVTTRLANNLPLLQLEYLQGRLGGKDAGTVLDFHGKNVTLRTGNGSTLLPANLSVHWEDGGAARPPRGELQASTFQLQPLADLAEYLPLPGQLRAQLAGLQPRGEVEDMKLDWSGRVESPERYNLSGRFVGLGARAFERIPGFTALSGNIDATEKGGSASLAGAKATLDLPGILRERESRWEKLAAKLEWKRLADHLEIRIGSLSFSNRDITGSLSGKYTTRAGGPGTADLTGTFSHVEAPAAYRYIPWLPEAVAEYLKSSIQAGVLPDGHLRLKGDLAHFPFASPSQGTFQVVARVKNVRYKFAETWPELNDATGELNFEGRAMRITASKASLLGIQLGSARAVVPDLFNRNEQLRVEGQAEDQTADFLRFIEASPVNQLIDGATQAIRATGNGRAQLRLDIPIRHLDQVKVSGSYQFINNQIRVDADVPALTQVNGRLDFTENQANARNIAAQALGGAISLSLGFRDGVFTVNTQGTAAVAALPRAWGGALLKHASGVAPWQAVVSGGRDRPTTLVVDSPLTGVAIDLPAPVGKTATQAVPLRLERTVSTDSPTGRRNETMKISLGRAMSAVVLRRREAEDYVLDRAGVAFSDAPVLPERPGISVSGSLAYLDADRWRAALGGEEGGPGLPVGANLKIGTLDVAGKRLNDLSLRAQSVDGNWTATLTAKEVSGEVTWRPEGRGRVVARFKHFIVPENAPGVPAQEGPLRDLPALDVVADSLVLRNTELGRLELIAVNEAGRDWRIERLVLANAESILSASGVWQSWAARPSTSVNMKLEISDVGRYLDRIGYPGTMRRGTAKLEGKLGWAGNPSSVDYPTLTGNLSLNAAKGQFLKAEPGVAKLLGVLSLQSWVTLDFRDVFGEGFAFDTMSGSAAVNKGVLVTEDFAMRGPSARVSMRGEVDLAHETQNLRVRVVPSLGDGASTVAGVLLANPIAGIGAMLAQRIFQDPLGQIFSYEYSVKGTWTAPKVERTRVEPRTPDSAAQ